MKIKGVIEDLKLKKRMIIKIVKTYLGVSLVLLWAVWGSIHFWIFPWSGLYFSRCIGPFYIVGTNERVLIYCTCHFQGGSLCFSFFYLLVSSVSNFHPDTGGWWWTVSFRLACSVTLWGGRDAANK